MRIHSIVPEIYRQPIQDDVLPLTKPIVGTSGKVYTELLIPKGTVVTISMTGYNLYIFSQNYYHLDRMLILFFSWQEPRFVGPGRLCVPTGALVRNERTGRVVRWGVWEPVRPRAVSL